MKKLPKIKPCPAGHEAKVERLGSARVRPYYVACFLSMDSGRVEVLELGRKACFWFHENMYRTQREAILAWNKRA